MKASTCTCTPAEKVCLSGPNGAGKTTLLGILGAAMSAHEGNVQFDGHPLNSLDLDQVRSMIGDSLNDEEVFAGILQENITVGRSWVSEDDVSEACRVTGLFDQLAQYPGWVPYPPRSPGITPAQELGEAHHPGAVHSGQAPNDTLGGQSAELGCEGPRATARLDHRTGTSVDLARREQRSMVPTALRADQRT
ncbi:MAG: ATP-binding cassette domain-containing protein [Flavobacteriales bacterium]|nr:ATP-binding cassette domain-containing protein [Flavobacteriales bacterium]